MQLCIQPLGDPVECRHKTQPVDELQATKTKTETKTEIATASFTPQTGECIGGELVLASLTTCPLL